MYSRALLTTAMCSANDAPPLFYRVNGRYLFQKVFSAAARTIHKKTTKSAT